MPSKISHSGRWAQTALEDTMQILSALNWRAILMASGAGIAFFTIVSGLFTGAEYEALGIKSEEVMPPPLTPALFFLFTCYLSTSILIALLIHGLGLNSWPNGLAAGLLVGIALFATSSSSVPGSLAILSYRGISI